MTEARILDRIIALFGLLALAFAMPALAQAQARGPGSDRMAVELVAEGKPQAGKPWMLALHFTPVSEEWHGYWSNPGDAGLGMEIDWDLPDGWKPDEPQYPLPQQLVIGDLMNHVYEGPYTVLVPIRIPGAAAVGDAGPIRATIRYLACTDTICVPQQAVLTLDPAQAGGDKRFSNWRAAIVPPLGSSAQFEFANERLRIGIPLPAASPLSGEPHVFLGSGELGKGDRPVYTGTQTFIRQGDLLVAEIPITRMAAPAGVSLSQTKRPRQIAGLLDFGNGLGVRFAAVAGDVPLEGAAPFASGADMPPLWQLLLAAMVGGLLLNVMPCVFPILSLKAIALARVGGDERSARHDALAYTAGVVLACAALGGAVLLARSAGEQIGWAFQLQDPRVVVGLLLLAVAITANFLDLFEIPGMALSGASASPRGSFATGLLAAFVATPCTGPFMALALGAALVIPPLEGLAVFVLLGLGLALPFLLIAFIPALRRRLPRPGPWMARFRRWMALPMGLTAVALLWLVWRLGGMEFLALAGALVAAMSLALFFAGRLQRKTDGPWRAALGGTLLGCLAAVIFLPLPVAAHKAAQESLLAPDPYSETALAAARASGQPVFVWFTADWCVTCKVNESVAIEREETRAAFANAGVISLRGDWTRPDEEISRMLSRQGAAGVPLYLWYRPGAEARQLPQVLTPRMLVELARQSQRQRDSARPVRQGASSN